MPDDVQVNAVFSVTDRANAPLQRIAGSAQQVAQASNAALISVRQLAGMAGFAGLAIGAVNAARETNDYLDAVKRIQSVTGRAAAEVSDLYGAFQMFGVERMEAERLMLGLSRASDAMEQGGQQGERMSGTFRRMGIDLNQGPVAALTRLSALAQQGAIHTTQLATLLRVRPTAAVSIMEMLQRGPRAFQDAMRLARESGLEVTDDQLDHFREMTRASHEIHAVWQGLRVQIGVAILPAMTRALRGFREILGRALPLAHSAGAALSGLAGHAGAAQGVASVAGMVTGIPSLGLAFAALRSFASHTGAVNAVLGSLRALWTRLSPTISRVSDLFGRVGSHLGDLLATVLPPLTAAFTRIGGAVGDVIDAVTGAVDEVWAYIGPDLTSLGTEIGDLASQIGSFVSSVFSEYADQIRQATPQLKFLADVVVGAAIGMTKLLEAVMSVVEWLRSHIPGLGQVAEQATAQQQAASIAAGEAAVAQMSVTQRLQGAMAVTRLFRSGVGAASNALASFGESAAQNIAVMSALGEQPTAVGAPPGVPTPRGAGNYFDFRGSRFDVRQQFAEGFDAGRVAASFTSDLAALGERRLQSGLAPIFSVH
jgi:hypothetical protein